MYLLQNNANQKTDKFLASLLSVWTSCPFLHTLEYHWHLAGQYGYHFISLGLFGHLKIHQSTLLVILLFQE